MLFPFLLLPALTACSTDGPLSALAPAGPGAERIAGIWWVMFFGSLLILAGVVALALYATLRRHERRWRPKPSHLIVGGGLVFTPAVLLALLIAGVGTGRALLPLNDEAAPFVVEVRAHQWWWEVRYPDIEAETLYSANEIHVPAGRPVDLRVTAADVIHSFWVPQLGGKIDALPGRTNRIRLQAPEPGTYRGQCAEFCGAQHARMHFVVQAHSEADLEERLGYLKRPPPTDDSASSAGAQAFRERCATCHSLDGRSAGPFPAPNLADLPQRRWLGGGTVPNDAEGLQDWLRNHQSLKPGNRMPVDEQLDTPTLHAIARYLEQLR